MALIGCLRPSPHPHELERTLLALHAAGAQRLPLGQLDQRAVVELVAEAVAAQPGLELLAEVAGARDNPLFVTELVAARLEERAVRTVDGRAEVARSSLPPSLRLTILRRLSLLPDDTLQALRSAAILGSSFALTDLSAFTGRPMLELSAVLAEAIRARVLEDDGEGLRFRHDLIHPSLRLALHREAGQRLARSGASALRVAEHLARGATRGDADAITWLSSAAREAAPRSPAVAAELLEQAIAAAAAGDHATTSLALTCLAVVRELREALRIIDEGARLAGTPGARSRPAGAAPERPPRCRGVRCSGRG